MSRAGTRRAAAQAAFGRCPRCAAARGSGQRYCLECGLALPRLDGALASLRRGWTRRVGWYPGDFVWLALLALAVAVGLAGASIALGRWRAPTSGRTFVASAPSVTTTAPTTPVGRGAVWPAGDDGDTVVLASFPAAAGEARPDALVAAATAAGLPQVGVLDSSDYASLQPGYDVVFSGIYGSPEEAATALAIVRTRGYPGAYTAPVAS